MTFWCFIPFIDTSLCQFVRYKHVQRSNNAGNALLLSETLTSNKNVWKEILTPMILIFWYKVVHKNYENLSIFVKITAKK